MLDHASPITDVSIIIINIVICSITVSRPGQHRARRNTVTKSRQTQMINDELSIRQQSAYTQHISHLIRSLEAKNKIRVQKAEISKLALMSMQWCTGRKTNRQIYQTKKYTQYLCPQWLSGFKHLLIGHSACWAKGLTVLVDLGSNPGLKGGFSARLG